MAATLDHLSGGRLILGLGAGWQENEHAAYGIDLPPVPQRLARFEEACTIVKGLLTQPRPGVLAHKGAVLDRHCDDGGRDPATIRRSAQAIVVPDAAEVSTTPFPGAPATVAGGAEQLRDELGRYAEAGVDELIVPDWNGGVGAAGEHFFDWFASEVAAGFR
jgi:alkanesulfonate monooxygenase SsuD/methylene tetrahydromethanopterin reductase-like flavin-dependent oxidoreductase (luciferase family)